MRLCDSCRFYGHKKHELNDGFVFLIGLNRMIVMIMVVAVVVAARSLPDPSYIPMYVDKCVDFLQYHRRVVVFP